MKRRTSLIAALTPIAFLVPTSAGAASLSTCAPGPVTAPPGARIESVTAVAQPGGTLSFPTSPIDPTPVLVPDVPAYCEVTVTVTHTDDHIRVRMNLPMTGWNGRFQAAGGSAYAAGDFGLPLAQAVRNGYAAGSTDAGVPLSPLDNSWGLKPDGTINQTLLTDFATRGVHDLAVVGKDVIHRFYGRAAAYSYWTGCSTGGRQGYSEAQNHPHDFNGILAVAPAINWNQFIMADLWPQVVMNQEHTFPTDCEFAEFQKAAVDACGTNGVIADPRNCAYDPRRLVGRTIVCAGKQVTITAKDAEVVRKIWDGPRDEFHRQLWPGLPKGASVAGIAHTENGTAPGFPVSTAWVRTFLERQPDFDTSTITYAQYAQLFRQSVAQFGDTIGTSDPDLSGFARAGGKLLTWHGLADQLIQPQGTIGYRQRVGPHRVDSYYRLFLAPGVQHCGGGAGPQPTDPLGALVNWVEHHQAPDTLRASNADGSAARDLCRYPRSCV